MRTDDAVRDFLRRVQDAGFYEAEGELASGADAGAAVANWLHAARLRARAGEHAQTGEVGEAEDGRDVAITRALERALDLEPGSRAAAWARRSRARAQRDWETVARTLEGEARHGSFASASDRAHLLVELAWVYAERLRRSGDALAACERALQAAPGHPAAALSLVSLASARARKPDAAGAGEVPAARLVHAIETLAACADAQLRAAWLAVLGWRLPVDEPVAVEHAVARVLAALREEPASAVDGGRVGAALTATLDRLSLRVLARKHGPALRLRVLDALDERLAVRTGEADRLARVMVLREKAALLVRQGQVDAAGAVLARAWALAPAHPLLRIDARELAELGSALHGALEVPGADARLRAEQRLAQADRALATGALGEAISALREVDADTSLAPLAFLLRVRAGMALQDPRAVVESHAIEAERLVREDPQGGRAEAAHLLVRAGSILEIALADLATAEACYRRAQALAPGYQPALEGVVSVLSGQGRWDDLVEVLGRELSALDDPDKARALRETILLIDRDVLFDPGAAGAIAVQLLGASRAPRDLYRVLEGAAFAAGDDREAVGVLVESVTRLAGSARAPGLAAALLTLGARLCRRLGQLQPELDLLERAQASDVAVAAPWLEGAALLDPAARRAALEAELVALERAAQHDRARALRFRIALAAATDADVGAALKALEPLRARGDGAARAWMLDLAERDGGLTALRQACAPVGADAESDDGLSAACAQALAEALERQGKSHEASERYRAAAAQARTLEARLLAGLGRLRVALARAPGRPLDGVRVAEALAGLCAALDGPEARALETEVHLLRLLYRQPERASAPAARDLDISIELPEETPEQAPGDAALEALRWGQRRGGEVGDRAAGRLRMLAAFAGLPGVAWRAALARHLTPVAHAASTDSAGLPLDPAAPPVAPLDDPAALLRTDVTVGEPGATWRRASQLSDSPEPVDRALAFGLAIGGALDGEREGDRRLALRAYALALRLVPDSPVALWGLSRLAREAGARAQLAQTLVWLAEVTRSAPQRVALLGQAATLHEELGHAELAVALHARVVSEEPTHAEAGRALRRLLRERGDLAGLDGVLSFQIAACAGTPAAVELLLERAQLRAEQLRRRQAAVDDYRRVLALQPGALPALVGLGELALQSGDGEAAARFLAEAASALSPASGAVRGLPHAVQVTRPGLLCRLAQAHVLRGQPDVALDVLLTVLAEQPGHRPARERVLLLLQARVAEAARGPDPAAARAALLRDFEARLGASDQLSPLDRGALLAGAAPLWGGDEEALPWFARALELAPLGEPLSVLEGWVARRGAEGEGLGARARALLDGVIARSEGLILDQALPELGDASALAPLTVRSGPLPAAPALEAVARLARLRGRRVRAAAAEQLAAFWEGAPMSGRVAHVGARLSEALLIEALELSRPEERALAGLLLLDGAALWAAAQEPGRPARGTEPADARASWLPALARALGGAQPRLVVQPDDALAVQPCLLPEPVLALGEGVLAGDAASRFRVARALVRLRFGLAAGEPPSDWARALQARLVLGGVLAAGPAGERERVIGKRLARHLPRAARAIAPGRHADLRAVTSATTAAVLESIGRLADRIGLAVCGDVGVAVVQLSRRIGVANADSMTMPGEGELRRSALRLAPVRDLLRFALSEQFADLHGRLGIDSDSVVADGRSSDTLINGGA